MSDSVTLGTVNRRAPLSMEISRQEYWSGLPFPPPRDILSPRIKSWCPMLQADFLSSEPLWPSSTNERHWFIIARTWKQPRCPSAEEWIRKLWYIYTMEYYSAIKKNTFESVLMRWMKLEPIIQSEVSQKEKHQYSILTHIYEI